MFLLRSPSCISQVSCCQSVLSAPLYSLQENHRTPLYPRETGLNPIMFTPLLFFSSSSIFLLCSLFTLKDNLHTITFVMVKWTNDGFCKIYVSINSESSHVLLPGNLPYLRGNHYFDFLNKEKLIFSWKHDRNSIHQLLLNVR